MTVYGQDLVNSALKVHWYPYSIYGARCDPLHSGSCDCSGLVSFAMNDNGIYNACGNSTGIETWCVNHGGYYVSRDFAYSHAGVLLAKWGYSADGHIKLATGDPVYSHSSFGTPSDELHGAGFERFDARSVNRYFTVPGVVYEQAHSEPPPPHPHYGGLGMLLGLNDRDELYLLSEGAVRWLSGPDFSRLRFIGVPYAGKVDAETFRGWARTWGVPEGTWPL